MPKVIIKKCGSYDRDLVFEKIGAILKALGGIEKFVPKGSVVLLKPNCLFSTLPETAITTHPEVVRAVIKHVKPLASRILIGDSPGFGSFTAACAKNGTKKVADEEGAEIIEFAPDRRMESAGRLAYQSFMLDSRAVDAGAIINLPKLKTHGLMHMTLCVKNMYGMIAGLKKLEYHATAGRDKILFAKALVDLYSAKKPALNILDGVLALEGNGPGTDGTPVQAGILAGSDDGFALDLEMPAFVGVDPMFVYTNQVLRDMVYKGKLPETDIDSEVPKPFMVFKQPPRDVKRGGMFGALVGVLRDNATAKPVFLPGKCTGCKICVTHCPVNALEYTGKAKGIKCDYKKCIRCFCCHEMCPEQAITVKKPFLSRMFG